MEVISPKKAWNLKQGDKFVLECRLGKFTLIEIKIDLSKHVFVFNLLSVGIFNILKAKKK